MGEDREDVTVFTDRLSYWRFIQDVEYNIRITKDKEIYNKNEMIAKLEIKSLQDYLDEAKAKVASERRKHPLWWLWYDLKLWFLRSVNKRFKRDGKHV